MPSGSAWACSTLDSLRRRAWPLEAVAMAPFAQNPSGALHRKQSPTLARAMARYVEIAFDCLPLRSVGRLDIPIDASPRFREKCERIKQAIERHGSHNTYFLHEAECVFHLTNEPSVGTLEFSFEGTVITDADDQATVTADLQVTLVRETCDWLTQPVVAWFGETVGKAVEVEFNRYVAAGDLEKTKKRIESLQARADQEGGYLGMYL